MIKGITSPEEIAFADDFEPNVLAAKNLGITALHFENFDKFITDLKSLGVVI